MTKNTKVRPYGFRHWNENNINLLTSNKWRASLVPAAAVIPAPQVYSYIVAVKKLVVGSECLAGGTVFHCHCFAAHNRRLAAVVAFTGDGS